MKKEIEVAVSHWSPEENEWVYEEEEYPDEQKVINVLKQLYLEINELPSTWRIIKELPVSFQEDQTSFLDSLTSRETSILQSYTRLGRWYY
jgi:glutathionyl-hydroquinone reductase